MALCVRQRRRSKDTPAPAIDWKRINPMLAHQPQHLARAFLLSGVFCQGRSAERTRKTNGGGYKGIIAWAARWSEAQKRLKNREGTRFR